MTDFDVKILKPEEQVEIPKDKFGGELRPIKCFILPAGAKEDKPSLAFILVDKNSHYVAQISAAMFQPVIDALAEVRREKV